jgi:hypothetical protein
MWRGPDGNYHQGGSNGVVFLNRLAQDGWEVTSYTTPAVIAQWLLLRRPVG